MEECVKRYGEPEWIGPVTTRFVSGAFRINVAFVSGKVGEITYAKSSGEKLSAEDVIYFLKINAPGRWEETTENSAVYRKWEQEGMLAIYYCAKAGEELSIFTHAFLDQSRKEWEKQEKTDREGL